MHTHSTTLGVDFSFLQFDSIFNVFFFLKSRVMNIKSNHSYVVRWISLEKSVYLCNHCLKETLKRSRHPRKVLPPPPPPPPSNHFLISTIHFAACFWILHQWNLRACTLLYLASSAQHSVFETHLCCRTWQEFTAFHCWVEARCVSVTQCIYPFVHSQTFGFPVCAFYDQTSVYNSFREYMFSFLLGGYQRVELLSNRYA